jgi:hypothetical protein
VNYAGEFIRRYSPFRRKEELKMENGKRTIEIVAPQHAAALRVRIPLKLRDTCP